MGRETVACQEKECQVFHSVCVYTGGWCYSIQAGALPAWYRGIERCSALCSSTFSGAECPTGEIEHTKTEKE